MVGQGGRRRSARRFRPQEPRRCRNGDPLVAARQVAPVALGALRQPHPRLPGAPARIAADAHPLPAGQRIEGGTRSEEHTSELQSLMRISYAVFCLKKKSRYKEEVKKLQIAYRIWINKIDA